MANDHVTPTAPTPFTETRRFKVMQKVIGALNPLVRWWLGRGNGGRMGRSLMLLRFQGRTSGKWYETPVGYGRQGSVVVVVTSPTYRWWRNMVGETPVQVRLDGAWKDARARIVAPTDPDYDETIALNVASRGRRMLEGFGVEVDATGQLTPAGRVIAANEIHIVRIEVGTDAAPASAA